MSLLSTTLSYDDIAQADMVIEAVFENMDVKAQVFTKLDAVMKPGAILASNTSTLDVDKIAEVTKRPQDVVGLHFFSPANVMRLLEVVRSKHTAKDAMATVMQVAKKIKKVAVVSGVCDGFIGNRMFEQYVRQSFQLVEEGATVPQVDKAAEAFGFAMGPFRVGDLAGQRHRLRHPQAPSRRAARCGLQPCGRCHLRAGPIRSEGGQGLVRLRSRQARADPLGRGAGLH